MPKSHQNKFPPLPNYLRDFAQSLQQKNTPVPVVTSPAKLPNMLPPQFDKIPVELCQLSQWISWKYVPNPDPTKKPLKVPINPRTGGAAAVNDPATWGNLADAEARCKSDASLGLGFVFTVNDPYCGIDLDACFDPQQKHTTKDFLVTVLPRFGSYTELSPSQTGLHIIIKGKLPPGGRKKGNIEMYDTARYFTFTGRVLIGFTDIRECQGELEAYHHEIFGGITNTQETKAHTPSCEVGAFPVSDDVLLEKARGAANGEKFAQLWEGQWQAAGYSSQSDADMAMCDMLAFWTGRIDWTDALFRKSGLYRKKWDKKHYSNGETYGQHTVQKAVTECRKFYKWPDTIPPFITVKGGGLSDEATEGEAALIAAKAPIYQRSKFLVRTVIEEVDAAKGRRTKVAQLVAIEPPYLTDQLCRCAYWQRLDARKKTMVRINPPPNVAQTILCRCGEWTFPTVVGVITTPTLRPDGSLLIDSGYDNNTRLILVEPPPMPEISEHLTRDDALEALALLDGLIDEFPFADDVSRSVALSAMMTPVVRGALKVAPMHAATAPTPGSGKSFLFDICAAISIGQICPVMAAGRNEEETEKRLGAALIAGQPIISIDNFNGDLGGDALCQIIERPIVEIRILGKSERVRIESRSTVFATGNNLRLVGDMTRRVIRCTLDTGKERPELRRFQHNPVADVLADRGKYIGAILIIVRAYIIAGKPNLAPRLASFEDWSDLVRSALIWLGRVDPVKSMESARRDDPILQAMTAVFMELKSAIGVNVPRTAADIVELALAKDNPHAMPFTYKYPALRDAVMAAIDDRTGHITAVRVGKWLSRHKGRITCGLRLDGQSDDHGHAAKWWITQVAGSAG